MFNTETVHWFYRCLIDGLFGLRGDKNGLRFEPQLPSDWDQANVSREFRGAQFNVTINRGDVETTQLFVDGIRQARLHFAEIEKGRNYKVELILPN